MTDDRLTDDELSAIEAQLARWERAAEHWQRHVTNPSLDEPSPAYLHEKLVEAKSEFMRSMPTAARLLLAHIRAQDAELARLRGELAAVKSIASEIRGALENIHGLARKDMLVDHAHEGSVRDLARAAGKALLKLEYPETDDDEGE